jgi:hypothetical protein
MHRTLALAVSLVALSASAQEWQKRTDAFRQKLDAERKKLGLDKKPQNFPTPEVKFVGKAAEDGVLAVVCPGESLVVTLDGVPPKSLVTANVDEVEISKETWAGNKWTGTLTAKKAAPPRIFSLIAVYSTSGQETWSSSYLLGCKRTLTFTVDDMTMTMTVDLRGLTQHLTGEWKKGGKSIGKREYDLNLSDGGFRLSSQPDQADMERLQKAMTASMTSPKSLEVNKRFEAAMKKMEGCAKLAPAAMTPCLQGVQPELDKISADREVINGELERASAPLFGCNQLDVVIANPKDSDAEGCAGHKNQERVPLTATWN